MENYYYKTPTKTHKDPTRFSGVIYATDFETDLEGIDEAHDFSMYQTAKRIISGWKFDERCRKNIEKLKEQKDLQKDSE